MTSPRSRRTPPGGGRAPLLRSFALRLGAAFAAVAVAGAGVTALVVNAAFAARFDHYLHQQQDVQVTRVSKAVGRAYAGNRKWDLRALAAVVPAVGTGTLRVLTPGGKHVWQWDGHTMSWNEEWMAGSHHKSHAHAGQGGSGGQGGSQTGCGGWDDCGSWGHDSGSGGGGSSGSWGSGSFVPGHGRGPGTALATGVRPATTYLAAATAASPAAGLPGTGQVRRIVIRVNGKAVGTALVRLPPVTALPAAVAFRSEVIGVVLGGGAAGALVSLALGFFFARRATRPVRQVTEAARALAAGERGMRLDAHRADEFGEMGAAFNAMAEAAEGEETLRQGFATEVAHELRTPLTILRSQVEGLRVGVLAPTPEALTSLDEEVRRMSRLVADLQILGSADAAGFSLERSPADLAQLADEAVREFAGLFEGSEIRLETRLEPVTAWADKVRVGQILANLLSNALKYTPAGGLVRVRLGSEPPWAVLQVSDSGPGIPADELPHVFDRFFRGRTARSPGTGTGLTVVAELARAHGGTVAAASEPGQGSTFTVRLPLQATPQGNRFLTDPSRPRPTVKA